MHFSYLNLWSALAIGLVICGMALVPSVRAKALLYVFPIPISIGIIATRGRITSSNLIGLSLIWVFMWVAYTLAARLLMPIIAADVLAAIAYIGLGFTLNRSVHLPFWLTICLFIAAWSMCVSWMHTHPVPEKTSPPASVPPAAKGVIAAAVSFGIYSVQHVLVGIVVTFPYNGIFAVVEAQHNLRVFARAVIRNTLAIGALFITMYYLQSRLSLIVNLCAGWLAFGIVVWRVQRISV